MTITPVIMAVASAAGPRTAQRVADQRASARMALRRCARCIGAPRDGWKKGADGAPLPQGRFYWSISHKRFWCAAVIADRPVGIDIEHVHPRHEYAIDAIADEAEWALMGDRSWHGFFRLWTAKEAVLKACGAGIAALAACRVVEVEPGRQMTLCCPAGDLGLRRSPPYWVVEHHQHEDHLVAVTSNGCPVSWQRV